jgi:two-component system response regulator
LLQQQSEGEDSLVNRKGRPGTVLMADDDPDDCLFVKEAFTETRMAKNFHCVEDGQELLEYLRRWGKYADPSLFPYPDLILLDLNMPRKDGRETLTEIKADPDFRTIPIVILTTSRDEKDIAGSYELGASSFITKPAQFEGFMDFAKTVGKYWFELVNLPVRKNA